MIGRIRNQRGFSLIEMMLAIGIASIVGVAIMKIFSANTKLFSGEKRVTRTISTARVVADEISRALRMARLNPQETAGSVFGIRSCNGAVLGTFATTAVTNNTTLCFTRDWDEDGALDNNGTEMVAFNWDSVGQQLQLATVDGAGAVSAWQEKWPEVKVTSFAVSYVYSDGVTSAGTVNLPDPATTGHTAADIVAITVDMTLRGTKAHEMTGQNIDETFTLSVLLRNDHIS